MNLKLKLLLLLATSLVPFGWAQAAVSFQFTDGSSINAAPGQTITLHLQLVATAGETSSAVDYLLAQITGPGTNVFSITGRDLSTSDYADPAFTDAQVTSSGDNQSPTGPDNLLNPQNDFDLGATKLDTTTDYMGGTHYIATVSLAINPSAVAGTYNIQTTFSTYGASDHDDLAATAASINIVVSAVPEPATWALLALGGIAAFALQTRRARHQR